MASSPYNRTRSKGGFVNVPNEGAWYYNPTCAEAQRFLYPLAVMETGVLQTTSDVVTPGFKKMSGQGKLIVSPYTSTRETQSGFGSYSRVRQVNIESCAATHTHTEFDTKGPVAYYISTNGTRKTLSFSSLITDAEIASAIGTAATQAWANSAGHQAGILQDIAEMRQTLSMFTRPLNAIQPLLKAMKSSQGKGVLKKLSDGGKASASSARNLWLQYRYGIRPLVSSVNGILLALKQPKGVHRQTYRGNYSVKRISSTPGSFPAWEVSFSYTDNHTDTLYVRTGLVMEEAISLSTSLGVDAGSMLALPWELVPLSFVADWFLNVGSFLESLAPALTKDPLASWVVTKRVQTRSWNVTGTTALNASLWSVVRSVVETRFAEKITTSRRPGIPFPTLRLKPQSLGKVFSDLRGVDAFALAAQQMGRLLKS